MYFLSILLISALTSTLGSNFEYDGWLNIKLQHSFRTNGNFTNRGDINIQCVRSDGYTIVQNPLTPDDLENLRDSANADDFYQLKSTVITSDNSESVFLSSMKAASLLETGLNDCITVWLLHNGAAAGVGVTASGNTFTVNRFHTDVFVRHMDQAPVPDTASYIQKLEREREAREKGEFKDTRSFLAKYWMYIVPVAIFFLISGAGNPEPTAAR